MGAQNKVRTYEEKKVYKELIFSVCEARQKSYIR